jgi:hypothetical protein
MSLQEVRKIMKGGFLEHLIMLHDYKASQAICMQGMKNPMPP